MTSGKHGGKPRIEMSQEPLFDDIDPIEESASSQTETPSFVDAFIESEVAESLQGLIDSSAINGEMDKKGEAAKSLADMLSGLSSEKAVPRFDSLSSELSTLAQELVGQATKDNSEHEQENGESADLSGYFKKQVKPQNQSIDKHDEPV